MSKILLTFDDKFRIEKADERNLRVQEYREFPEIVNKKKTGKTYMDWDEKADCYYGSIRGALSYIAKRKLKSDTINAISDVISMIDDLNKRIDILETTKESKK